MNINDFKNNESFLTATGEWICLDKGSKTILAVKKEDYDVKKNWDDQSNVVIFYPYDFGGCHLTKQTMYKIGSPERTAFNIASRPHDYQFVDCRDCRGCAHCEPENY